MPQLPTTISSASGILKFKLQECRMELDYLKYYQEAYAYQKCRPFLEELRILTQQQNEVEPDLGGDELAARLHHVLDFGRECKYNNNKDDQQHVIALLERVYAAVMYSKSNVRGDSRSTSRTQAGEISARCSGIPRCIEIRRQREPDVLPSHGMVGVGKCESDSSCAECVKGNEVALTDRRNGMTLHAKIGEAMDARTIAIVPIVSQEEDDVSGKEGAEGEEKQRRNCMPWMSWMS
ncbi:hypothetical protein PABG_07693 [Paracoccidioides brasiliensis Pb03]|nr:hypothetical protein PABG_07693 [Paracoccidioides brasiliensis Pb03]